MKVPGTVAAGAHWAKEVKCAGCDCKDKCNVELGSEVRYNLHTHTPTWDIASKCSKPDGRVQTQMKCNQALDFTAAVALQAKKGLKAKVSQQVNLKKLFTSPQDGIGFRYGFSVEADFNAI